MAATTQIKFPPAPHTHSEYLPLTGGTVTGQIQKSNDGTQFVNGRDKSIIKSIASGSTGSFASAITMKTSSGTYDIGTCSSDLYISYAKDEDYNKGNNAYSLIKFGSNGTIEASDIYLLGSRDTRTRFNQLIRDYLDRNDEDNEAGLPRFLGIHIGGAYNMAYIYGSSTADPNGDHDIVFRYSTDHISNHSPSYQYTSISQIINRITALEQKVGI